MNIANILYEARVTIHYAEDHNSVRAGGLIATCTDGLCPKLLQAEEEISKILPKEQYAKRKTHKGL